MGTINYTTDQINTLLDKVNAITVSATDINNKVGQAQFSFVGNLTNPSAVGVVQANTTAQATLTAYPTATGATKMYISNAGTANGFYLGFGTTGAEAQAACVSASAIATTLLGSSGYADKFYIDKNGAFAIISLVNPTTNATYTFWCARSVGAQITTTGTPIKVSYGN